MVGRSGKPDVSLDAVSQQCCPLLTQGFQLDRVVKTDQCSYAVCFASVHIVMHDLELMPITSKERHERILLGLDKEQSRYARGPGTRKDMVSTGAQGTLTCP